MEFRIYRIRCLEVQGIFFDDVPHTMANFAEM